MTAVEIAGAAFAAAFLIAAPATAADGALSVAALASPQAEGAAASAGERDGDRPRARALRLAQTYSSKCVTPTTICFVDPAPVGNPCQCGSSQGRIQR